MQELGLQVVNVAGRDLIAGPDEFDALRGLGIDFVSANILVDGQPLVERFRVYERRLNGRPVRIGVTGVTSQSRAALERWQGARTLEFADPVASARSVLEEMRGRTEIQVLLAELPPHTLDEMVAPGADGFDLLISSLGRLQETTPVGPAPVVVAPGDRCKQMAWLNLRLDGETVQVVGGEVLALDEKIADLPETAARVLELKERLSAAGANGEGRVSASEADSDAAPRPADATVSP